MHYHLEIIMPPVANITAAIAEIMEPFKEEGEDEDGNPNRHTFWDFYVIGGRWAGNHLEALQDKEKMDAFYAEINKRKVTVSGMQFGKQELAPADQIPMVDALWNEFFPDSPIKVCPIFRHFNDQFKDSNGFPDIMKLKDIPKSLKASHVIVAGLDYDGNRMEAKHMMQEQIWNGVTHLDTKWDCTVEGAIADLAKRHENYKEEYVAKNTPQPDWLVVTVDYHS